MQRRMLAVREQKNMFRKFSSTVFFRSIFSKVEPLKIVVRDIEIMNDDPKDVDVLYAKVHININKYNSSFQKFVNGIADKFSKRGKLFFTPFYFTAKFV